MPRVVSFIVLVAILLFIASMFFKVMAQFVLPLFLAAVLVVVFKPLHMWVRDRLPGRLRLSALVTTFLILLIVLLPTAWLGWNAYLEGRSVFNHLKVPANKQRLVERIEAAAKPFLDFYEDPLGERQPSTSETESGEPTATEGDAPPAAADEAGGSETAATNALATANPGAVKPTAHLDARAIFDVIAGFFSGDLIVNSLQGLLGLLLGLIIMVLAIYYFLVDGPTMIHTMMRLSPLDNEYERELLDKFANVSRAVVVAVLAAAVVQGLLAGIGFYFALTPVAPIFLLVMVTMVLAVVPFVGAAGVWIPTCIWIYLYQERMVGGQIVTGDPMTAIFLALYCGGVVSTIDNVIKPLVLHGQSNLHPLLALMSVLGGVKALGPVGILVGPMLVAFVHALLVMVNKELRLLSIGDTIDGQHQKSLFPANPGEELPSPDDALATDIDSLTASTVPPQRKLGAIARVRNAAKRRRRKK